MTDSEKLKLIVEFLKAEAEEDCWDTDEDDFNVDDYAGGNIDDAFYGGVEVGRVEVAVAALALINEE